MCPQDQKTAAPFHQRIAEHFAEAQSLEEAERFYIKAGMARQVSLHTCPMLCFVQAEGKLGAPMNFFSIHA